MFQTIIWRIVRWLVFSPLLLILGFFLLIISNGVDTGWRVYIPLFVAVMLVVLSDILWNHRRAFSFLLLIFVVPISLFLGYQTAKRQDLRWSLDELHRRATTEGSLSLSALAGEWDEACAVMPYCAMQHAEQRAHPAEVCGDFDDQGTMGAIVLLKNGRRTAVQWLPIDRQSTDIWLLEPKNHSCYPASRQPALFAAADGSLTVRPTTGE